MTDPQVGLVMLGIFIFIICSAFPIAFTLMALGVGFGYYAYFTTGQDLRQPHLHLLVQNTFEVLVNDVLMAIPLFLFMGYHRRARQHSRPAVHSLQLVDEARAGLAGGGDAGHLRAVRDRHRHRRRGGHA